MDAVPGPSSVSSTEPRAPEAPAPRQRRGRTILGRLTAAVREQHWSAVVLEVVIVVLGVVIGFQITAWGEERSQRVHEREYLEQLAQDLLVTQASMQEADSTSLLAQQATVALLRGFFANETPPIDSALTWRYQSDSFESSTPLLATANALISTGDIALIRNDTLRTYINAYVDNSKLNRQEAVVHYSEWRQAVYAADARIDFAEARWAATPNRVLDSLVVTDPFFTDLPGRRRPFPIDAESLFQDRELYNALRVMAAIQRQARGARREETTWAEELLSIVEAELAR